MSSMDTSAAGSPTPIPDEVAGAAPGADLQAMIESIEVEAVSGFDVVVVMKAWARQVACVKAQFLKAVLETGIRRPGSAESVSHVTGEPGEFAAEEVRAALVWSRRRAGDTFALAVDVHARVPAIGAAMLAGHLDEHAATALATWTRGLAPPDAQFICDELIPAARTLTVAALIDRIKRLAIMLDPGWAERRYREALTRRRVDSARSVEGTVTVSGRDLPIDRAKAGCDRIDTLARGCKTAGDNRPVDHIRADLFLGMIDGTFTSLSDGDIITHVLAHPLVVDDSDEETTAADQSTSSADDDDSGGDDASRDDPEDEVVCRDASDADEPGGGISGDDPDGDGSDGDEPGGGCPEPPAPRPGGSGDGAAGAEPSDDGGEPDGDEPGGDPVPPSRPPGKPTGGDTSAPSGAGDGGRGWGVRELRVELTTAIGCDDHPGEIPPWGYIPAPVARDMIAHMGEAEWRFVICDRHGRPICSGITAARPGGVSRSARRRRGAGIVELQVRASDLSQLDAECAEHGAYPQWAPVVTDIAARIDAGDVDSDAADHEARRRTPGAGLRRLVQVRARYCTHPACTIPAMECDQDHAVEYAHGGATDAANLHPPCHHDHRLRHDGGWHVVIQPDGATIWTSALGHIYSTRPPPVMIDPPKPWDRATRYDIDDIDEQHRAKPPPAHEPAHLLDDDPPPF